MNKFRQIIESGSENRKFDCKDSFTNNEHGWIELTKDIIAFANMGMGYLVFGVDDKFTVNGVNSATLAALSDASEIKKKIQKYVKADFELGVIIEPEGEIKILTISINNRGNHLYPFDHKGQVGDKTIFSEGQIVIRGDGRNELLSSNNSNCLRDKVISCERIRIFEGMGKIINEPGAYKLVSIDDTSATTMRISSGDKDAIPVTVDRSGIKDLWRTEPVLISAINFLHGSRAKIDQKVVAKLIGERQRFSGVIDDFDFLVLASRCAEFPRFFLAHPEISCAPGKVVEAIDQCWDIEEKSGIFITFAIISPDLTAEVLDGIDKSVKAEILRRVGGVKLTRADSYFCTHFVKEKAINKEKANTRIGQSIQSIGKSEDILLEERRTIFGIDYMIRKGIIQ